MGAEVWFCISAICTVAVIVLLLTGKKNSNTAADVIDVYAEVVDTYPSEWDSKNHPLRRGGDNIKYRNTINASPIDRKI